MKYVPNPNEIIPDNARCADCGTASVDAGRYRKADPREQADDDGEIYECANCGGLEVEQ